jgi:hypothetical protein
MGGTETMSEQGKGRKADKPVTRQKVQSVLRKADHRKSEYHPSGQVRGWGERTEGYRVLTDRSDPRIIIEHYVGWTFRGEEATSRITTYLTHYLETLAAAGIRAHVENGRIIVE